MRFGGTRNNASGKWLRGSICKGTPLGKSSARWSHPAAALGARTAPVRSGSAEFHSAVSPICNRLGVIRLGRSTLHQRPDRAHAAECNSAIRQIENLRYSGSAELHSAVSPICNRLGVIRLGRSTQHQRPDRAHAAECNSAIQQIENLRYSRGQARTARTPRLRTITRLTHLRPSQGLRN